MGHLLNYALTSAIYLSIGYLCYRFILSGARQHTFNRLALHAIVLISLITPLVHLRWPTHTTSPAYSIQHATEIDFELIPGGIVAAEKPVWPEILLYIYLAGCIAVTGWTILSLLKIRRLVAEGERHMIDIHGVQARLTITENKSTAPFSWIRSIVIGRDDYEENSDAILIHEAGHIRHAHSFDMLAYLPLTIFQWFNPAMWLILEELRSVHEYEADSDVMESGVDIRQYQMMLIKKAVGTRFPSPANSLNHSNLKNRITMMYKSNSRAGRKAAALLVVPAMALAASVTHIPAVASVLSATASATLLDSPSLMGSEGKISKNLPDEKISTSEIEANDPHTGLYIKLHETIDKPVKEGEPIVAESSFTIVEDTGECERESAEETRKIYQAVETQAEFPGGMPELMRWLANNIRYPEKAHNDNVQGRVIVKFVIGSDGKVTDPQVLKGVSPELDGEAVRIVNKMPVWKPAEVNGKPVDSFFTLPVSFRLVNDTPKQAEDDKESENDIVTVVGY